MNKRFKRIYIELSNYCNLNCVFCTPKNKNNRMLNDEQFHHILNQVSPYTDEVCFHVLGEPLLHPSFQKYSNLVREKGLKVQITTNGRLIKKKKDILLNSYFTTMNISLHSAYDLCDEDRRSYLYSIVDFIEDYHKLYPKTSFHLRLWANNNEKINLSNQKILKEISEFYDNFEINERIRLKERVIISYEKEFEWPTMQGKKTEGHCLGGKTHIAILANGKVSICCLDAEGLSDLGNIFEEELSEVLNRNPYLSAVKEFRNNKACLEICKYCTYKKVV